MESYDVIVHPTDFSEDSDQAFRLACNMARDQFATLVTVHVLPSDCGVYYDSETDLNDDHSPVVEECRRQFLRLRALAPDIPVAFRLVVGHVVGAILKVAAEVRADLIVIASHRHDQFHLQLHGSVAEGVLRQTHCPVVVLRQPTTSLRRSAAYSAMPRHAEAQL
jgi:nucleotide-binding universal stress UspA family protein